jgi:hypothetical protein
VVHIVAMVVVDVARPLAGAGAGMTAKPLSSLSSLSSPVFLAGLSIARVRL